MPLTSKCSVHAEPFLNFQNPTKAIQGDRNGQ
jgi:hypothetical protein